MAEINCSEYVNVNLKDKILSVPQVFEGCRLFSQWSQDYYVNKLFFNDNKNGIFVDVGAASGTNGSNSYFFEKNLGWNGVCIEPIPSSYSILRKERKCLCFNSCAYDRFDVVDFTITNGFVELSGISDEYNDKHLQRIECERNNHKGQVNEKIKVLTAPLQWYIDSAGYKIIDLLSIDTEGSEFSVIKGIDFEKTHINVICFEDNYIEKSIPILEYLLSKNFTLVMRLGGDFILTNNKLRFSWSPEKILDVNIIQSS